MSTQTATIKQSQSDWNEITILVGDDEGWITSTAHTFTEVEGVSDLADFDDDQWLADIDTCLAEMGYARVSGLTDESDFVQTCDVVAK